MRKKQAEALKPFIDDLKQTFAKQLVQAGHTKEWAYDYAAALVATYQRIRRVRIAGKRLTRALGRTKQAILLALVSLSTDRDAKVRNRWATAARFAIIDQIAPDQVPRWLRRGGGLAGRASEARRTPEQCR
jgi:hypothetical protein